MILLAKSIVSTSTCPTAHLCRKDPVSTTGTQDTDPWPHTVVGSGGGAGYVVTSPQTSNERWKMRHSPFSTNFRASDKPTRAAITLCGFTSTLWSSTPCASQKTQTTTILERTPGVVQLQQSKVQSRRGCKRPFVFS